MNQHFGYLVEIVHETSGEVVSSNFTQEASEVGEFPYHMLGFFRRVRGLELAAPPADLRPEPGAAQEPVGVHRGDMQVGQAYWSLINTVNGKEVAALKWSGDEYDLATRALGNVYLVESHAKAVADKANAYFAARTQPAPGAVPVVQAYERAVWDARGEIIKQLAAIVNLPQTDKQFDDEVVPRDPLMAIVQRIKSQVDAIGKAVPRPVHPTMQYAAKQAPSGEMVEVKLTGLTPEQVEALEAIGNDGIVQVLKDALPSTRKSLEQTFRHLSDNAYCNYIKMMQRTEALGWEEKVRTKKFGLAELTAHTSAARQLGRHKAFFEAANALRGSTAPLTMENQNDGKID